MQVMSLLGNSAVLNAQEQRFILVDKQNNYWKITISLSLLGCDSWTYSSKCHLCIKPKQLG